jgi:catechol 2,3-dioxygenase-like lactoylglutathione lyase family enzyme
MKITLTNVIVNDQARALSFYTEVLGFVKKTDLPMGGARFSTVVSPEGAAGVELLLEPTGHPASKVYQKALFDDGIPYTSFESSAIHKEYERLTKLGVVFRGEPTRTGPVIQAVFEDTCGNLIALHQLG